MSVFLWDQATKDICLYLFKDKYKVQIEDTGYITCYWAEMW